MWKALLQLRPKPSEVHQVIKSHSSGRSPPSHNPATTCRGGRGPFAAQSPFWRCAHELLMLHGASRPGLLRAPTTVTSCAVFAGIAIWLHAAAAPGRATDTCIHVPLRALLSSKALLRTVL